MIKKILYGIWVAVISVIAVIGLALFYSILTNADITGTVETVYKQYEKTITEFGPTDKNRSAYDARENG